MHQKAAEATKTRRLWILEKGRNCRESKWGTDDSGQKAENQDFPSAEEPWEFLVEMKSKTPRVKIPVKEESWRTRPDKRLAFSWRYLPNSAVAQGGFKTKLKAPENQE